MAHTEKDLEIEGHTLPSAELIAEAVRLVDLARTHAMVMRPHGYDVKHFTEIDQVKDMVLKEHNRVEGKPPKPFAPSKDQEKLLVRAYQWRAQMVRRADRVFHDDRYNRLKYHRNFVMHGEPTRLYEELFLLIQHARVDIKRLAPGGVDSAFLGQGEDICFELQGTPAPNRKAQEEYEKALKEYSGWGPEPQPPPPLPSLPAAADNAKNLSVMRGRLYLMLRQLSAAGQLAFSTVDRDAQKAEQARRDFVLRVRPQEDDEELITYGRKGGPAAASASPPTATASPSSAAKEAAPAQQPITAVAVPGAPPPPPTPNEKPAAAPSKVLPMEQVTVKPGGANPLPPQDPFKKPPPRAVGLVRPSPTHGTKRDG
jgi:hypothetical protein